MKNNFYFLTWLGPRPNFSLKLAQPTPFFPHPCVAQLPQHAWFTWPDRRSPSAVDCHRVVPPRSTTPHLLELSTHAEP
jgi:hypothetical protein